MTTDEQREAFRQLMELSDELGLGDGPFICERHDRHEPCRPCLWEEGFYDSPEWLNRHE